MAVRGKFGRRPTVQPSLSNTIVEIARAMQNQRDQNIMDAWKNGGLYEGKPVTDEMVLAHWSERMKHVSKDDPLYDTYQMTHMQLEYSVAESKMTTKYAQGKVGAGAMARFYLNWAKKIPKNSEFHRVLERNAAQFQKSLRSGGRGGGGRRGGGRGNGVTAEEAFQMKWEVPAMYLTQALTEVARSQLVIAGDEGLDKVRLGVEENDPGAMVAIIDALNTDPNFASYKGEVQKVLHMLNPSIPASGDITIATYTSMLQHQSNSINKRAWAALSEGSISKFTSLLKQRDKVDGLRRQAAAWGATDQYFRSRDDFLRIWNSQTQTPDAKLAAAQQYQTTLKDLHSDAQARGDSQQAVALDSEIRALAGDDTNLKPTIFEDFSTMSGAAAFNNQKSDAFQTAESVQAFARVAQSVANHEMVYTYGTFSGGKFTAKPGGDSIGAIDVRYLQQDPSLYKAMPVAGAFGMENVFVQGAPIMAIKSLPTVKNEFGYDVTDPNYEPPEGGEPGPQRVGTAYDVRSGDLITRVYGIPQGDGTEIYTTIPPWSVGVSENFNQVTVNGQDAVVISMPAGMATPYGFSDPASVARTGVTPAGAFLSPYLAVSMASPEGVANLTKFYNSPGEVMQYATQLYGTDQKKAIAAYGEILTQGHNANIAANIPEDVGEKMRANFYGAGEPMSGKAKDDLISQFPALSNWEQDYALAQGIESVNPKKKEWMPEIKLPALIGGSNLYRGGAATGSWSDPTSGRVTPITVPTPPVLNTGFEGNPGKALDDILPKPPPPPKPTVAPAPTTSYQPPAPPKPPGTSHDAGGDFVIVNGRKVYL